MTNAIRAEFRKFFTTRMWWGMAIAIFVAGAGLAVLFGFLSPRRPTASGPPAGCPDRHARADRQQRLHERPPSATCSR